MDHYRVLGLPSGEEGARLSGEEITRAYRSKAKVLHPDKRPRDDPHAHANFIQLKASYLLLRDETERKLFDEQSRKRDRPQHQKINTTQINRSQTSNKRHRDMVADLRAREEEARFKADREKEALKKSQKLKEEIENIVAQMKKKKTKAKQGTTTAESSRNHAEVFSYNKYPRFAEFQAFEDSVLEKLRTAAHRQEQTQT